MRALLVVALVACSSPRETKTTPPPTGGSGSAAVVPIDAPEANQEERLAAIQKAMNELDEAAQGCWAIAATERFDIEGEVEVLVEISQGSAKTQVARDTTRNSKLLGCLVEVLAKYRWAPPLYGQAIKLPFKFRAPNGQNTIDRNLVGWAGQGKVSMAVLLDENNSNNPLASMLEVALQTGGATGMRVADRVEVWYFLGAATIEANKKKTAVAAGDMMFVPAGAARDVQATGGDVHAMIVFVPGGREGTSRAGALPTRELAEGAKAPSPIVLPAAKAKTYGPATIYAEPATIKAPTLAASVLQLPANANVAEHVHAKETELLYILAGSGTMTVDGQKLAVTPTTVIQIPPNTKHAFTATTDTRVVQIYTPAGPEQRFKAKP